MKGLKILVPLAAVLALVVIVLGAYTRLTDAGLGCPDWPGCYGHLTVPHASQAEAKAPHLLAERPLERAKAWNEMIHRYFAGSLGLLVALIALLSWRYRRQGAAPWLASGLLVLIVAQALLGMWTVTLKLLPQVVMLHLLGGFATFT